ncbi:hypothetical protein L209DRAFT_137388 [Thermothelomyces heterothallicus CBS 203.75]
MACIPCSQFTLPYYYSTLSPRAKESMDVIDPDLAMNAIRRLRCRAEDSKSLSCTDYLRNNPRWSRSCTVIRTYIQEPACQPPSHRRVQCDPPPLTVGGGIDKNDIRWLQAVSVLSRVCPRSERAIRRSNPGYLCTSLLPFEGASTDERALTTALPTKYNYKCVDKLLDGQSMR